MAVANKRQNFNSGTTGSVITAANSATSGDALSQVIQSGTGTGVYGTTAALRGGKGAHVTGVLNDTFSMLLTDTADPSASAQVYLRLNAVPTVAADSFGLRSASANVCRFVVSSSGQLLLQTGSGTTLKTFNSGTALSTGTIYRLQLQATKGTTTTDGFIAAQLYSNSDTLIDSYSSSTVDAGTADITTVRCGKVATGSDNIDIDFDELGLSTATTVQLTAVSSGSNVAPTADAGADQTDIEPWTTVTLDGSGSSDSDGTIASYAWTQTVGTTVTLSGSGVSRTFTAPAVQGGVTLTFSLVVTDNNGATSTANTVNVVVLTPTAYRATAGSWAPMKITSL